MLKPVAKYRDIASSQHLPALIAYGCAVAESSKDDLDFPSRSWHHVVKHFICFPHCQYLNMGLHYICITLTGC